MKGTELSFAETYLDKIREGKETPFDGEAGTGAWFLKKGGEYNERRRR